MGFAGGTVSFQRFFVDGPMLTDVTDTFLSQLQGRAFGRLATLPDDTELGWIGPGHLFETELRAERIAFGRFVLLALRVDTLKAPPAVVRSYVRQEEETALQASGREYLSKGERKRARQAATDRAAQEVRAGAFRRSQSYPALFDLAGRTAYLGALGQSVGEKFMVLFHDTFGANLTPAWPETLATRKLSAAKRDRALEGLMPSHLIRPPAGAEETTLEAGDLRFLGREFLSWLWFNADRERGGLSIAGGDDVTVAIEKSLKLVCDFNLTGSDTIAAESPTALPEARAALTVGKQPTKAGLVLGSKLGEFHLALDALRMTVSGLVLPEEEGGQEADYRARLEQRFEQIADVAELLDGMFEAFLLKRTSTSEWTAEHRALRAWAGGKEEQARLAVPA